MSDICSTDICTGCGACANICPKQCISWVKDGVDTLYPSIDKTLCVNCDACRRVCPNNNKLALHSPIKTFATWSLDTENRRTSASGGITSEFYRYTLKRGGFTCGAELTLDKGVNYIPIKCEDDIKRVKNSKYVFSHTNDIYRQVLKALKEDRFVFFVGLPCQVAGLKSFLGKNADNDNLLTADIICHGVSNEDYLFQYVHHIERVKKQRTESLTFRDPYYGTEGFVFALRAKTYPSELKGLSSRNTSPKPFYKQNHYGTNLYYIGYMEGLTYRENCYHCSYARSERVSDLTFGDFDGLGKDIPFAYDKSQVSLCFVNTEKGQRHLSEVADNLFMEERTLEEAVKPQGQLKAPSTPHPKRTRFIKLYYKSHDFAFAAKKCLKKEICHNIYGIIKHRFFIEPVLHITTKQQREKVRRLLKM